MKQYAIGIDLGGTMIKYAIVSSDGEIIYQSSTLTPLDKGVNGIVDAFIVAAKAAIDEASQRGVEISGIGIGTPGIVSKDGRTVVGGAENIPEWHNLPLADSLEASLGLPVAIMNDANAMALGESIFGAARNVSDAVFVTVGTGIGGAVMIDGSLWRGYNGRGMELGHISVDAGERTCACGGKGCLEMYASTSALVKRFKELTGNDADGRIIVSLYNSGDEKAIQAMTEHWRYLGRGIASFINIFSPQMVVVGGGISEAGSFYLENLSKEVFSRALPVSAAETRLVAARLGNTAGCLGAASLAFRNKEI